MSGKTIAVIGAILAGAGVGLGAFHAHGLDKLLVKLGRETDLPQRMAWFDTAARYQMYHALGCLGIAALATLAPSGWYGAAAGMMVAGVALFCGSLYAMSFLGAEWRWLGAVTPFGGLAFILGWICTAIGAWRS